MEAESSVNKFFYLNKFKILPKKKDIKENNYFNRTNDIGGKTNEGDASKK